MRRLGLPQELETRTHLLLEELDFSWSAPGKLAQAVSRLSNFYIANPNAATPWHEPWAQAAYLAYYLPLNFARAKAVADEGVRTGFFRGLTSFVDFGSGLGSAQMAVACAAPQWQHGLCVDRAQEALSLHGRLLGRTHPPQESAFAPVNLRWSTHLGEGDLPPASSRLAILSYVYTELAELPTWVRNSEALLILEPSTREDGRRLLELRQSLLEQGFRMFAPCTHQGACPLLVHSQKDWCHDRIEWAPPDGWPQLEKLLPMKNKTLTFSYLLARKSGEATLPPGRLARMIGDPLPEKGKSRQLVCRSPEREFLAWFPGRMKTEPQLDRGDLIAIETELETRSNEVRVKAATDLKVL